MPNLNLRLNDRDYQKLSVILARLGVATNAQGIMVCARIAEKKLNGELVSVKRPDSEPKQATPPPSTALVPLHLIPIQYPIQQ